MILGIDHVQLAAPAGCETAARQFYGEVLGLEELAKPPLLQSRGGCWFQCGTYQLHIGVDSEFRPARKAHPAILVSNLDSLRSRLRQHGISVQDDTSIPETIRCYVSDPWGNRLEFVQAKESSKL